MRCHFHGLSLKIRTSILLGDSTDPVLAGFDEVNHHTETYITRTWRQPPPDWQQRADALILISCQQPSELESRSFPGRASDETPAPATSPCSLWETLSGEPAWAESPPEQCLDSCTTETVNEECECCWRCGDISCSNKERTQVWTG